MADRRFALMIGKNLIQKRLVTIDNPISARRHFWVCTVLTADCGESGEGIETDDAPIVVEGLVDTPEHCEQRQILPPPDTKFGNDPMNRNDPLIKIMQKQKSGKS